MASFWQNKAEKAGCNDRENALNVIISRSSSITANKTKMEQADALNSQNKLKKAYEMYKDVLHLNSRHSDALFGIGVILEKQRKFHIYHLLPLGF